MKRKKRNEQENVLIIIVIIIGAIIGAIIGYYIEMVNMANIFETIIFCIGTAIMGSTIFSYFYICLVIYFIPKIKGNVKMKKQKSTKNNFID